MDPEIEKRDLERLARARERARKKESKRLYVSIRVEVHCSCNVQDAALTNSPCFVTHDHHNLDPCQLP